MIVSISVAKDCKHEIIQILKTESISSESRKQGT